MGEPRAAAVLGSGEVMIVAVPAVHRASLVLGALAACSEPVSFGQLAAKVQLPRSSLHDVCTALVQEGLVDRGSDGLFQVGFRIVELARIRLARTDQACGCQPTQAARSAS